MKTQLLLCSAGLLLMTTFANAGPVLLTGTPSDSYNSPAIDTPSPNLGGILINFDSLTPFTAYSTYNDPSGVSIYSPDGLVVYPYSTESGPNELFDNSVDGSADIDIDYAPGATAIGVGIADSDITAGGSPVTIYLQALNSSGAGFGTLFSVTLPETDPNPGNGYFVIEDTTPDIYGVQITQPVGNSALYSGLAIDDVQVAPEPSSFVLLTAAAALFGAFRMRQRA